MSENQNLPAIEMRGATVGSMHDATFTTIADLNWSVIPGEFWVVAGQQQSGKSDLLMLTAGLMAPLAGNCKLFGAETQNFGEAEVAERLRVGFVFEGGQLFNQLTIAENVALPLRYHKDLEPDAAAAEVKPFLDLMELTPLADVTPANVAANWRQRAALARALVLKPDLLLLDNPLSGLNTRHLHWWLRFLDQLSRGHEICGGKPLTIVLTAEDFFRFAGARGTGKQFAMLHDKKFIPLGAWRDLEASHNHLVKELLAVQLEPAI
jgi:ABC-type transporter Mla maintaining outer membrane lipid asymmetry ATPase subunit MlaF